MRRGIHKRELYAVIKKVWLICFICILLLEGIFYFQQPFISKAVTNTDYSEYSSTEYSWYIVRKDKHKKAGGGIPAGMNFSKYDSFYMNKKTKKNVIYLSFDCGYENGYTDKLLNILKKHKAKAIFFVTKAFITSQPELVIKMKKQGHLVGNHTCSHPSLPKISVDQIKSEINECADTMKKTTGYTMDPFVRPPMGCFSEKSLKVTKDLGYKTIFWSMAYHDYDEDDQPGKDYVIDHFKKNYHKGALPLIHNISSSNCEALDEVLTFLEKKKYRFGTLDEFALPKGKLKISCRDKVYNGKKAAIKIIKNTNKRANVTFMIKNNKGEIVKQAIEPGTYTVLAWVESSRTYRFTVSNMIKFTIKEPPAQ